VINTPSDPYHLPVNLQDFAVDYNVAEGAQGTDQTVPQNQITFDHKKLMVATIVSTEFEEDSVLQTLALLKQAIGEAIALKEEKRFFNEPNYILAKAADQSSFFTSAITSALHQRDYVSHCGRCHCGSLVQNGLPVQP
jgi:HK97 family phage major capsid protein